MSRLEELIEKARKLKEKGLTTGEIADELNVSRETAIWLLTRATAKPSDVYVELNTLTSSAFRLRRIAEILADIILDVGEPDVVVGIATSGIPLATMVAQEIASEIAVYYPKKLRWEQEVKHISGTLSENFAKIDGKSCAIVDDIMTTGSTIREVVEYVQNKGKALCAAVIVNKTGLEEINNVPVYSLIRIERL